MATKKINIAELKKAEPNHSWRELAEMFNVSVSTLRRAMDCKDKFYPVRARKAPKAKAKAKAKAKVESQVEAQAAVLKDYLVDRAVTETEASNKKYLRQEVDEAIYFLWQRATKDLDKEEKRELFESALSSAIHDLQYPDLADEKASCLQIGLERKFALLESIKA